MGIEAICNAINNVIDKVRPPIATIPAFFLICAAIARPGLSAMLIASRIIRRQAEAGASFGNAADGSANVSEAMEFVRVDEMVKALKMESRVQSATPIGGAQILSTGSNMGGPVVSTGFNILPFRGDGIVG